MIRKPNFTFTSTTFTGLILRYACVCETSVYLTPKCQSLTTVLWPTPSTVSWSMCSHHRVMTTENW